MKASLKLAVSGLALALASSAASAQTVISRSIAAEPVETTVTETPTGTIVTRRPIAPQPAVVAPQPALLPAPAVVETIPNTVDAITTRQVGRRAEAELIAPALTSREVAARSKQPVSTRQVSAQRKVSRTTRVVRTTQVARPAPRLELEPRERQIVYRTIVEREVVPAQQMIVAPRVAPAPPVVAPALRAPVVAAEDTLVTGPITVGTVLPANVPLYAIPENVAITVPATRSYSYAWLDGRAYLVEPASGTVVADVSE